MHPHFGSLLSGSFGMELVYSFVIIVCSLMVYFATKELYDLSLHRGIKYFRQAFLFFALAYMFRHFIKTFVMLFDLKAIIEFPPPQFPMPPPPALPIPPSVVLFAVFIFMYASSMAVFYLLYSVIWKKSDGRSGGVMFLFYLLAIAISMAVVLAESKGIILLMEAILFLFLAITIYRAYLISRRAKHDMYIIYLLVFAFWMLNIMDIFVPRFALPLQMAVYLASIFLFLLILYKVLRKVGPD